MRIRPPSEREAGEAACLQHTGAETLCLLQQPEPVHYTLDHVAGASRWGRGWEGTEPDGGHVLFMFVFQKNMPRPPTPACSSQHDMFKIVGRPIVETVLAGYNSSVFVYGQTGSGKVWGEEA